MANRKNYNSILFLTVYLGLVLVGGNAQVFAHAASNSLFDLRNEIEFKDDLDNKPDDELKLYDATGGYFVDLEWFIEDLQELHKTKKFVSNSDSFQILESHVSLCGLETVIQERVTRYSNKVSNDDLRAVVDLLKIRVTDFGFYGDCLVSDKFDKQKAVTYEIKADYDQTAFSFELSLLKESPQKAKLFADKTNQALAVFKVDEDEIIVKSLHENTKVTFTNNQVFIVTRLPRASIDSLLK